ncbi:MAG: CRISPR-associated endonuclease Cas3'' [Sphingomonadales bacterium]|nr:CRISPR-associated endonuclease Cas3'' [Sphingomonadales bacterium]
MKRFAHSVPGAPEADWEPLEEHLAAVGQRAAQFALPFGASSMVLAMGLLHDIGKCALAYQTYIRQPASDSLRKGPDHSTAGAIEASTTYKGALGRLMAFGIAGHHGGLMDGPNLTGRLIKQVEDYTGWEAHAGSLPSAADMSTMPIGRGVNAIDKSFTPAFLARMAFSCLVDADFIETERFYAESSGDAPPPRGGTVEQHHLDAVRAHMAGRRRSDTELNCLRSEILDHANAKAALPPGLFTLTVPTGGGKTLTSLSFALEHALEHDLRRVIYVIPFTSIIEQTAAVFREQVKLGDAVLEHHSSFDWDRRPPATDNDAESEGPQGLAKLRLDAQNWDAPIVVTTAVQFFESLFAARTSQSRKLHNLAKSVIVLDEAQSIPVHLLRPCMAAIDELAKNYGASVVLCTATQPALRVLDQALPQTEDMKARGIWEGLDIPDERELAPDPARLYEKLKRVHVEWRREPVEDAEIAARFAARPQMLCIVNSRAHARDLFLNLREQGQDGAVHLTTLMCAKHRRAVLAQVRDDLANGRPVRLVATSLIEAGVDVDFPEVWRAAAGLASIAQAAGRCNREGGPVMGRTVVFEAAGRKIPPMIEAFYGPARTVLRGDHADMLGLEAIHAYYRELYWQQGHAALDKARLPGGEPLEIIRAIREGAKNGFNFPFETIARAFRLIDETMDPVIVPWDDTAREAIAALRHAPVPPAGVQRQLQQYVVPVPAKVRESLLTSGAVQAIKPEAYGDRFMVLEESQPGVLPELYDHALGLRLDRDPAERSAESNIIF